LKAGADYEPRTVAPSVPDDGSRLLSPKRQPCYSVSTRLIRR